jgi:hypothetical protein
LRRALAGLGITPPEDIGTRALIACSNAARRNARCEIAGYGFPVARTLVLEGHGVCRITKERAVQEFTEAGDLRRMWEEEREERRKAEGGRRKMEEEQAAAARYVPWTGTPAARMAVAEMVPVNETERPAKRNLIEEMEALCASV